MNLSFIARASQQTTLFYFTNDCDCGVEAGAIAFY